MCLVKLDAKLLTNNRIILSIDGSIILLQHKSESNELESESKSESSDFESKYSESESKDMDSSPTTLE